MAKILFIHTGGTLGMTGGRPDPLRPGALFESLDQKVPELRDLAEITFELFCNVDSSEMQPELWSRLAAHLHERLDDFDGAVITHGTDTLAYTASALSFMLPGLDKAVVLTGSQRPLGELRTDARLNLIDAVTSALSGPREVTLCFGSRLYRGNRARKAKISEYDAFESPNFPLLGTLGVKVVFEKGPRAKGPRRLLEKLEPRVFLLKLFPGLDPALPMAILPHVRGLVVEAFGAGNFPADESFGRSLLPLFAEARARNVPVLVVSQAQTNGVDLGLYESSAAALTEGAIGGRDMTSTAAVVKLMHALAHFPHRRDLVRYLERSVAGEMTT